MYKYYFYAFPASNAPDAFSLCYTPTIYTTECGVIEPARAILFFRNRGTIAISCCAVGISFAFCDGLIYQFAMGLRVYGEIKRTVSPPWAASGHSYVYIYMYTHFAYTEKERADTHGEPTWRDPAMVTKYFAIGFQAGVQEAASYPREQREKEIWERGTREASRSAATVSLLQPNSFYSLDA